MTYFSIKISNICNFIHKIDLKKDLIRESSSVTDYRVKRDFLQKQYVQLR